MRPVLAIATVAALSFGASACAGTDTEELRETVEQGISDATEAVGQAAEEVQEKASEVSEIAQFCTAAARTAQAVNAQDWDAAIEHGETMVAEAPDDIRPDAEVVLDGAKRYADGDQSAVASSEFQTAAENVKVYTEDRCDPR